MTVPRVEGDREPGAFCRKEGTAREEWGIVDTLIVSLFPPPLLPLSLHSYPLSLSQSLPVELEAHFPSGPALAVAVLSLSLSLPLDK